jgi:hypothetical protein
MVLPMKVLRIQKANRPRVGLFDPRRESSCRNEMVRPCPQKRERNNRQSFFENL